MAASGNDWQLRCEDMKQRGAHLLQSGQLSDCTFLVGTKPNQLSIAGHKFILAMASPVFEAMFYGSIPEKNDPVHILDIEPDTFKDLLVYMYTDKVKITSFEQACELSLASKKYFLSHLKEQCLKYIVSNLKPANACLAYEFAKFNDEHELMAKSIQIISEKTKEVLEDENFLDVELDTVITIFSLEHLKITNELDLFNAAKRYLEAQEIALSLWKTSMIEKAPCQSTKSVEPSGITKAINGENVTETSLKAVSTEPAVEFADVSASHSDSKDLDGNVKFSMRSAIEKIRFLALTPEQFAQGSAQSKFLTQSEAYAIFMNMLNTWTDVPMPRGFSTSKAIRSTLQSQTTSYNRGY